ncbi:MAG: ABC transporter ATP-binding protein [Actinobacteria bacterium]|nr:ABC transporter ATP-binding protein [Actinomycetota bacterium]MCB9388837.1 ABC transporter ATP-binding protein [Acidimicrobiia bacterium]
MLRVDALSYSYPGSTAKVLEDVSLALDAGERVALVGPNGSGKTTLVLHLNGLLGDHDGSVQVSGIACTKPKLKEIRQRVGLLFQDPNDQLFMQTVRDDVSFGPANLGLDKSEIERRVEESLRSVSASHLLDRAPHHLSGGEQRRCAIATVLAMRPDVLVFDEPTAGLDPKGCLELSDLLNGLSQTQLIVTHDLPFALATCPRTLVLQEGSIKADLSTRDLISDPELLERHGLALPFGYVAPR